MSPDDSERVDFLLTRYGQLNQEHSARNQVIHRTFYLSLIFGMALLGLGSRAEASPENAVLAILGALIFTSLGLWTRSYVTGRNDTQRQREVIINELETNEYDFQTLDGVRTFFPEESERDRWERTYKDKLLYVYYMAAVILSLLIFTRLFF